MMVAERVEEKGNIKGAILSERGTSIPKCVGPDAINLFIKLVVIRERAKNAHNIPLSEQDKKRIKDCP